MISEWVLVVCFAIFVLPGAFVVVRMADALNRALGVIADLEEKLNDCGHWGR